MSFLGHCEQYVNYLRTLTNTLIIVSIPKEIIELIKVEFLFIYYCLFFRLKLPYPMMIMVVTWLVYRI